MKEKIKENIHNPEKLEQLYQDNKNDFESGFKKVYNEIEQSELLTFWKVRLDYNKVTEIIRKTTFFDILILILSCLLTGFLIKTPDIFTSWLTDYPYFEKNTGIIVFLGLTLYWLWSNKTIKLKKLLITAIAFLVVIIYVNLLPSVENSDTINLVYIHLPLLMWSIYGLVFIDFDFCNTNKRVDFIRYNGDLAILMALLGITGGIMTGITIGLFDAIGINIENFYMGNIAIVGIASLPIVATYIIKYYPTLTNKFAPIIATLFSPLVLLTAVAYLIALSISGKNPFSDREFLLIFNIMLLLVMAVIVFSISEASNSKKHKFNVFILFILSIVTAIINAIALSAIFYRLGAYGFTPNRLAVLGSNLLIFGNLIILIIDLYKVNFKEAPIKTVENTIAKYFPIYLAWILVVIVLFPIIFGLK
ncbi:MAG: hypothetical protein AB7S50_03100 [Bacteroidales bacterium]